MKSRIAILIYKPKAGKAKILQQLIREHLSVLKDKDLVTDRESVIMEAQGGTVIEAFEWRSGSAMAMANKDRVILEVLGKCADACDYIPAEEFDETKKIFSDFLPLM